MEFGSVECYSYCLLLLTGSSKDIHHNANVAKENFYSALKSQTLAVTTRVHAINNAAIKNN